MKIADYKCETKDSLGYGVKKSVLTDKNTWYIMSSFWDSGLKKWYIRAKSLVDEKVVVDFHVSTSYWHNLLKQQQKKC